MRVTERDRQIVSNYDLWPGDTCCMKQYNESVTDYIAFGVLVNNQEPVTIFLRGDDPKNDFQKTKEYLTIEDMFADNWVVD